MKTEPLTDQNLTDATSPKKRGKYNMNPNHIRKNRGPNSPESKIKMSNANRSRPPKTGNYKGVSPNKVYKPYKACIDINSKQVSLGNYVTEIEAALAYDKAVIELIGLENNPYLNFPERVDKS